MKAITKFTGISSLGKQSVSSKFFIRLLETVREVRGGEGEGVLKSVYHTGALSVDSSRHLHKTGIRYHWQHGVNNPSSGHTATPERGWGRGEREGKGREGQEGVHAPSTERSGGRGA